jgi:hypothetical protein
MSSTWLDRGEVERRLQLEAQVDAGRLGHRLGGWELQGDGISTARCALCHEVVTVAARRFRRAPIAGVPVVLRCVRRAVSAPARASIAACF